MSAERFDDDRLATILASIGEHLEIGDIRTGGSVADESRARGHRRSRRLFTVAASVLLVTAVLAAIAPVRRTVGGWFRVGDTEVVLDPASDDALASLPEFVAGGVVMDTEALAAAGNRLGVDLDALDVLGPPDLWLSPPEGGVVAAWHDGSTTLALRRDANGQVLVQKYTAMAGDVTEVPDLGDGGVMFAGDHVIVTPSRTAAAGRAVVWQHGELTVRLESDLPDDDLLALAEEIDAKLESQTLKISALAVVL